MIMRTFLFLGLLLLGGTAYFVVGRTPPTVQAAPFMSNVTMLQEEGLLPVGPLAEDEEVEHDVFEVPPQDEVMLEAAIANMDMSGMDMGNMDMAAPDATDMGNMDMGTPAATDMGDMAADTPAEPDMGNMDMGTPAATDMGDMAVDDGEISEEETERLMAGQMAGLIITDDGPFDREISLSMSEWTFSDLDIEAQPGERIRFTLRNDGETLHEFMFMSMAGMQGVNYRARRADWSLLEHVALYEKSLMLPGEEITFVAEVLRPGGWMFMCMLPYHMQMGMMGQIATPGMAMDM
ncbi:MAG: multicopper oxidase domain-containing protein [Jannaschia helgolandensis]